MRAADRHHRGRGGDEDPRQVPARARERGVGPAARARPSSRRFLRTYAEYLGLDAQAARRGVQAALRAPRPSRPAADRAAACGGAPAPRAGAPRSRARGSSSSAVHRRAARGPARLLGRARRRRQRRARRRHDDDDHRDAAATASASRGGRRRHGATGRADARARCRSSPTGAVYVCLRQRGGQGADRRHDPPAAAADAGPSRPSASASRSATARARMRVNGKTRVPRRVRPVGYRPAPGPSRPRELPASAPADLHG